MDKPFLVTLTSPSAAGKSHLLSYIRNEAKLPCLVSTTTRKPRTHEIHGREYYFITKHQSIELEENNELAELVIYDGARYGVTKDELKSKLAGGLAFLIIEPSGIQSYVEPIKALGAYHLSYYIHTPVDVRVERFKERIKQDIINCETRECCEQYIDYHVDRLVKMMTTEMHWFTQHGWHRVLFGTNSPEDNLKIILNDIQKLKQS